jgi:predicted nucleic acid-binding protein
MLTNSNPIIIADTSCLILLSKIGELELLRLISEHVYITNTVKSEFGHPLPEWMIVKDPNSSPFQKLLEREIDPGEISAILLALETPSSILIMDDMKGRKVAQRLNLSYSGTLGMLLKAKKTGSISEILPILNKIRLTDFRIDNQLLLQIQKAAGE